jgi:hypothetical protein
MNRILVVMMFLLAFTTTAHAQEPIICEQYTTSLCNESMVPTFKLNDALDLLYFRPSVITSWRLVQSPGTMNPNFVLADGTASTDDFMSGIVMPADGWATLLRVNQTAGAFALQYTLQINGMDTPLTITYDEFSPSTNTDVAGFEPWAAGDVLTLEVIDATTGEPVKTYATLSGFFQ